jgi:hypothetical protein
MVQMNLFPTPYKRNFPHFFQLQIRAAKMHFSANFMRCSLPDAWENDRFFAITLAKVTSFSTEGILFLDSFWLKIKILAVLKHDYLVISIDVYYIN